MRRLTEQYEIRTAISLTNGASGSTPVNGVTIDMHDGGYDQVIAVIQTGPITAGAVTSAKLQQGAVANMSDAADLAGTGMTISDASDDQIFILDAAWDAPMERYVRLVVSRATQAATVSAVYFLRKRTKGVAQPAGVTVERHLSPAEGAA